MYMYTEQMLFIVESDIVHVNQTLKMWSIVASKHSTIRALSGSLPIHTHTQCSFYQTSGAMKDSYNVGQYMHLHIHLSVQHFTKGEIITTDKLLGTQQCRDFRFNLHFHDNKKKKNPFNTFIFLSFAIHLSFSLTRSLILHIFSSKAIGF